MLEDLIAKKERIQQERLAHDQGVEASLRMAFEQYLQLLDTFAIESGWKKTDIGMRFVDPYSGAGNGPSAYVNALVVELSPSKTIYAPPYFQFAGWLEPKFWGGGATLKCKIQLLPNETDPVVRWPGDRTQYWKGHNEQRMTSALRHLYEYYDAG